MIEKSQFMKFPWNYGKLTFRRKMQKFSWICLRSINHHCGSKEHLLKHVLRPYHFHEKNMRLKNFFEFFQFLWSPQSFCGVPKNWKMGVPSEPVGVPKNWKMGVPNEPVGVPKNWKMGVPSKPLGVPQKKTWSPKWESPQKKTRQQKGNQIKHEEASHHTDNHNDIA